MEDIKYFKDMLESIPSYRKIILLCFIIKRDDDILKEFGFSNDFIRKLYEDCKQIMIENIDQYYGHIKNLEETIIEKFLIN